MDKFSREYLSRNYSIRKLQLGETIKSFDCGDADLNDFIITEAPLYRKALLAVTYVMRHKETDQIIGYFSLANDRVSVTDFKDKTEFNRFRRCRFVNEKRLKSYPAVKLCRLGVKQSMHGKKIGRFLLNFIKSYFLDDNKTGCRFLTVDAYPNAVPFYEKNDFLPLRNDDEPLDIPTQLLFFDLRDIEE
ncbi:MAG: GNAT family N-acetyltransferase [Bacteroidaceae bacterium]|nr:GNAT family N-acetyltransferase [Bacteroidaceae bacterium]